MSLPICMGCGTDLIPYDPVLRPRFLQLGYGIEFLQIHHRSSLRHDRRITTINLQHASASGKQIKKLRNLFLQDLPQGEIIGERIAVYVHLRRIKGTDDRHE